MRLLLCFGCTVLAMLLLMAPVEPNIAGNAPETLQNEDLGTYELWRHQGEFRAMVFLLSRGAKPTQEERALATALTERGMAVVLVDSSQYQRRIAQQAAVDGCIYLPAPLERISQNLQRRLGVKAYHPPRLVGLGQGASWVYLLLAQASPSYFHSGLSVDFSSELPVDKPFCQITLHGHHLPANPTLGATWTVATTQPWHAETLAFVTESLTANPKSVHKLEQPGSAMDLLIAALSADQDKPAPQSSSVADLPLVEVSTRSPSGTLAVIWSGDGGWRDLDKVLGDYLAQQDIAVIGVDALRYFWAKRTPEEVGRDLQRILAFYLRDPTLQQVVLIGYSFGADILPFAYNRLSPELKARVTLISLLTPGLSNDFEVHISGWLGISAKANAYAITPELLKIPGKTVQCFYGADEEDESLCKKAHLVDMEIIKTSGGHHFDGDYSALGTRILQALAMRTSGRPKSP